MQHEDGRAATGVQGWVVARCRLAYRLCAIPLSLTRDSQPLCGLCVASPPGPGRQRTADGTERRRDPRVRVRTGASESECTDHSSSGTTRSGTHNRRSSDPRKSRPRRETGCASDRTVRRGPRQIWPAGRHSIYVPSGSGPTSGAIYSATYGPTGGATYSAQGAARVSMHERGHS